MALLTLTACGPGQANNRVYVGKYSYGHDTLEIINYGCESYEVSIGSFTSIAFKTRILLTSGIEHNALHMSTFPFGAIETNTFDNTFSRSLIYSPGGNVYIGSDVWIGENVSIKYNVNIGDGAVIAAKSHVVTNVEPYAIYGGNPARLIKYRFTEDIIKELLEFKWWNLPDNIINFILPSLRQPPTLEIVRKMREYVHEKL